jgi:hypothetical protein
MSESTRDEKKRLENHEGAKDSTEIKGKVSSVSSDAPGLVFAFL